MTRLVHLLVENVPYYCPSPPVPKEAKRNESGNLDHNLLATPSSFVKREGQRQHAWCMYISLALLSALANSVVYQGPTSSWSFTHRILQSMAHVLCPTTAVDLPIITDGNAYQAQWTKAKSDAIIDTGGLPSQGHAFYLLSTVNFHIGHVFHLYDSEEFAKALQDFYGDIEHKAESSKLWYIQFLVIMAFGETFLLPPTKSKQPPVCSPYFTRAMSLLPDFSEMWNDPILSIEVLALVALYLYSLDMRDSSCCYVRLQFTEVGPSIDLKNSDRSSYASSTHRRPTQAIAC